MASEYGYQVEVAHGYDEAVVQTRLALKAEGFSILTEMHVGGMLGPEGGDERQYLIMGAFGPATSTHSLNEGVDVAVHVPCNFVVQESGSSAIVAALDPAESVESSNGEQTQAAISAREALGRVLQRVSSAT
jgi:uncharacterized protein (DUF302 family)